jgi:hypothetical protein
MGCSGAGVRRFAGSIDWRKCATLLDNTPVRMGEQVAAARLIPLVAERRVVDETVPVAVPGTPVMRVLPLLLFLFLPCILPTEHLPRGIGHARLRRTMLQLQALSIRSAASAKRNKNIAKSSSFGAGFSTSSFLDE